MYLRLFFLQQCDIESDISLCVMLLRCNRDRVKMASEFMLRRHLYFLNASKVKGQEETEEVVLQQIMDSLYCLLLYGDYFSGNDSESLSQSLRAYETESVQRPSFNVLYSYRNEVNVREGNKFLSSIKYENQLARNHGNNKNNIFGVNMRIGSGIEKLYLREHRPFYGTMKEEVMNHSKYGLSAFQWNDLWLKMLTMRDTFWGKELCARKPNVNEAYLCQMTRDRMAAESQRCELRLSELHLMALMVYSQCNKLKKSLLNSYHILGAPPVQQHQFVDQEDKDKDDIQNWTRRKHFGRFYHFGRLLLEAVKVFGRNLYDDVNRETLAKRVFYHAVNLKYDQVVSWRKTKFNTFGPISVTTRSMVSFLYNDSRQSTVLELDLNGGTVFSQNVFSVDISFLSDCPFEEELLLNGGLCLGIRNIISLKIHPNNNERSGHREYYQWMECILMLRIVIGDIYWKMDNDIDSYFTEKLVSNEAICHRLEQLIVNELEFDSDDHDSSHEIPKSVRKLFHSYCDHVVGYLYVRYSRIIQLPPALRSLFLLDSDSECIDCKFVLDLLPNIKLSAHPFCPLDLPLIFLLDLPLIFESYFSFIYGYDFIFDDSFCKHLVGYLRDDQQRKNRLMYVQFERFDRQKQSNESYFEDEIAVACDALKDSLEDSNWNIKKSAKWECVKFENKELMEKYTVRLNPFKVDKYSATKPNVSRKRKRRK